MNIKENKRFVQEITTGIHLTIISKIGWVLDKSKTEEKVVLKNALGESAFEMIFTDNNGKTFKNKYWLGGEKQKFFEGVLSHIGVNPKAPIKGKEILQKRIWIAVCEVVDVIEDAIQTDTLGEELKSHFIFKTFPFIEGGTKPYIEGDPEINGVPQFEFRRYKDVGQPVFAKATPTKEQKLAIAKEIVKPTAGMVQNTNFASESSKAVSPNKPAEEEPNFGDDEPEITPKAIIAETVGEVNSKTNVNDVWSEEPNFD